MNEGLYFFNLCAAMHEKNPFTHEETAKLWVEYWAKKWSMFLMGPNKTVRKESIIWKAITKTTWTNLFFTINGFHWKRRLNSAVNSLNCFFFDVDLKWTGISKEEALIKMEPIVDAFEFITETRNWFHCFQLVSYGSDQNSAKQYLDDRSEWRKIFFESTWIQPDPACKDVSRIARIPWSRHVKDESEKDFRIRLIKGHELLKPSCWALKEINDIPILKVLDCLWVKHQGAKLMEYWAITDWWVANIEENYVNDFSGNGRPVWWPYSFVLHHYLQSMENSWNPHKDKAIAGMKVYSFFGEHFWISVGRSHKKTFEIPSKILDAIIEAGFPWAETKLLLGLVKLTKQEMGFHMGKNLRISLSALLAASGVTQNITRWRGYVESLIGLIAVSESWIGSIFSIQLSGKQGDSLIDCSILSSWDSLTPWLKSKFFLKKYLPIEAFSLPDSGMWVWVWSYVMANLVLKKEATILGIEKAYLCEKYGDGNSRRLMHKLEKIFPQLKITLSWANGKREFVLKTVW